MSLVQSTADRGVHLLQVSSEPILFLGGVSKIVQWIIQELPSNYSITLACPDAEKSAQFPVLLRNRVKNFIPIPAQKWSRQEKQDFCKRVRKGNFDLVHFHGGTFSFDSCLPWRSPLHSLCRSGIPWILSNHCAPSLTSGLFSPNSSLARTGVKSVLAWFSKCFLVACCKKEVFDSRENQQQIAQWFPWSKKKFTTIYHSGIEGTPPEPELSRPITTIGNLGHIAWRKGQQDLLQAFSLLQKKSPQLQLVLAGPDAGDGCLNWLQNEIGRLGLQKNVHLVGGLENTEGFWKRIDLYVQPSHFEGAPIALMEALWRGKPSVGTRVSGIPEIIDEDRTGLLVESKNPEELAAAMGRLVIENETRQKFSAAAAAGILAKGMTRSQMGKQYVALYQKALVK